MGYLNLDGFGSKINNTVDAINNTTNTINETVNRINSHLHPAYTISTPSTIQRFASVYGTSSISNNQNIVLGNITYTFVTSLGTPTQNNVHIKISTIEQTLKLLAKAVNGEINTNIAYGVNTSVNSYATGFFTKVKYSFNDVQIAAGNNVVFWEKAQDTNASITLTTTLTGASVLSFQRLSRFEYIFTNASTGLRSPWQVIVLPYALSHFYDLNKIYVETVSSTSTIKELDLAYSLDEESFTLISTGISVNKSDANRGVIVIPIVHDIIQPHYGLYVRGWTSGTNNTEMVEFKMSIAVHNE